MDVGERAGGIRGERSGHEPAADARQTEAGAFLVREARHRYGPHRLDAAGTQLIDGEERGDDAERSVERSAVGNAVEVAPRDNRAGSAPAPPCPQVAITVLLARHLALGRLFVEPRAKRLVLRGPR